jgi:hypothetical protein
VFTTQSPLEMSFDEDERGKRVYFAVKNVLGSDIFNAVIP